MAISLYNIYVGARCASADPGCKITFSRRVYQEPAADRREKARAAAADVAGCGRLFLAGCLWVPPATVAKTGSGFRAMFRRNGEDQCLRIVFVQSVLRRMVQ